MKNSIENIQARHKVLLDIMKDGENHTVTELSTLLKTSETTIRRDLTNLAQMGKVVRSHGKARIATTGLEIDKCDNEEIEAIKEALAKTAASFVKNSNTVFINSSSAALDSVKYLINKQVTIITNNVKVAALDHNSESSVFLSGGEVRFPKEALIGQAAQAFFETIQADIAIIGCYGISAERGLTTPVIHEAKINEVIVKQTDGLVICIADYRKIGESANFKSCDLAHVDYLITDTFANQDSLKKIEDCGVTVIQIQI
ncbi:DeoR family transcriptional regulator [Lactococcus hodotermopsidis]|uniref:DeoR family transcriptional regulator n=1 Tax=Pseudolactococcus hodotermopsidis TaxID=2709157 RepID=A0A6A0BDM0_9LACT|nr:DeoR/GlpR family DNA-binding transcription regulator [Lactococcus hodotermopsidis]GFH42438.1 DeoR family transcriptional regulator [Lactococcus hodotermopsidis]